MPSTLNIVPPELLCGIGELLSTPDLAKLVRVNTRLNMVLTSMLYKRVDATEIPTNPIRWPTPPYIMPPFVPITLPPLHWAAYRGNNPAVVKLLALSGGSDVAGQPLRSRHRGRRGERWKGTPLFFAAMGGNVETVEILLAHGSLVDAGGASDRGDPPMGVTPLMIASVTRSAGVVATLLRHGANYNLWTTVRGYPATALHLALMEFPGERKEVDCERQHVEDCADDGDESYKPLDTPEITAARVRIAGLLLDAGMDVDIHKDEPEHLEDVDEEEEGEDSGMDDERHVCFCGHCYTPTPLLWTLKHALGSGSRIETLVRFLLKRGANINACDQRKATALHHRLDDYTLTKLFLEAGANVHARTRTGQQPLHRLLKLRYGGSPDIARLLLDHGADPYAVHPRKDMYGQSEAVVDHLHRIVAQFYATRRRVYATFLERGGSRHEFGIGEWMEECPQDRVHQYLEMLKLLLVDQGLDLNLAIQLTKEADADRPPDEVDYEMPLGLDRGDWTEKDLRIVLELWMEREMDWTDEDWQTHPLAIAHVTEVEAMWGARTPQPLRAEDEE